MINKSNTKNKALECASCVIKPCQVGCPLNNDITSFIKYIKEDDYESAYNVLCNTTVLPSVCGRICPHDSQCQGSCVKRVSYEAVKIGDLIFLAIEFVMLHFRDNHDGARGRKKDHKPYIHLCPL